MLYKIPADIFYLIIKDLKLNNLNYLLLTNKCINSNCNLKNISKSPLLNNLNNKIISKKLIFEILESVIKKLN